MAKLPDQHKGKLQSSASSLFFFFPQLYPTYSADFCPSKFFVVVEHTIIGRNLFGKKSHRLSEKRLAVQF